MNGKKFELNKHVTLFSGYTIIGKFGDKQVNVTDENKGVFSNTRIIEGKFGTEKVRVLCGHNTFSKGGIDVESLPKNFEPMIPLIMTIQNDEAQKPPFKVSFFMRRFVLLLL